MAEVNLKSHINFLRLLLNLYFIWYIFTDSLGPIRHDFGFGNSAGDTNFVYFNEFWAISNQFLNAVCELSGKNSWKSVNHTMCPYRFTALKFNIFERNFFWLHTQHYSKPNIALPAQVVHRTSCKDYYIRTRKHCKTDGSNRTPPGLRFLKFLKSG